MIYLVLGLIWLVGMMAIVYSNTLDETGKFKTKPRVDYYNDEDEGLSDGALLGLMTSARLSGDKFTESYAAWQYWDKKR